MACVRKYRDSWVCDWRDPSGKRYIEAHPDKDTAERRLADVIRSGKQGASKRLSFKDYGDWWLENCAKGHIADSTYQEYDAVLKNHVYPLLGSKPFAKVNRAMIRELIAAKKEGVLAIDRQKHHGAGARNVFPGNRGRQRTPKPGRPHREAEQAIQGRT
jgi:hypothetical protein